MSGSDNKIYLLKCSNLNCQQLPKLIYQEEWPLLYRCACGKETKPNIFKQGGVFFLINLWNVLNSDSEDRVVEINENFNS